MTGGRKWETLLWLSLAFFTTQASRTVIGVINADVQRDLAISKEAMGALGSVLTVVLALMVPLSGVAGDRFSRKRIITGSVLLGGVATAFAGFSAGFWSLALLYSVTCAICGALFAPSAYPLVADYHQKTRSLALSILQGAYYLGIVLGACGAAVIAERMGWRSVFAVFGAMGTVWGALMLFRLKDPPPETRTAAAGDSMPIGAAFRFMASKKSVLAAVLAAVATLFVHNLFWFWVPNYIQDPAGVFRMSKTASSGVFLFGVLPSFFVIIAGGAVTDAMVRRYSRKFRMFLQMVGLIVGGAALLAMGACSTAAAMWGCCLGYAVGRGLFDVNICATIYDLVPGSMRSKATSLYVMCGFLCSSLGMWLVGRMMDAQGVATGMKAGFRVMGGLYLASAVLLALALKFWYKTEKQYS